MEFRNYQRFAAGYTAGLWSAVVLWLAGPFGVNPLAAQLIAGFFAAVLLLRAEIRYRNFLDWQQREQDRMKLRGYGSPPPLKETDV